MEAKRSWNKKRIVVLAIWIAACIIGILRAIYCLRTPDMNVKIIFDSLNENDSAIVEMQIGNEIFINRVEPSTEAYKKFELDFPLYSQGNDIQELRIFLSMNTDSCKIKCIEISNHSIQMFRLAPIEIPNYFVLNEEYFYESPYITISNETGMLHLSASEEFVDICNNVSTNIVKAGINVFVWMLAVCGMGIYFYIRMNCKEHKNYKEYITWVNKAIRVVQNGTIWVIDNFHIVANVFIISAGVFVFIMAVKSQLYGHPDETVTKLAIDYYLGGWIKPDLRSRWAVGTFSNYGFSRLNEPTFYYLIAGKIGWIFKEIIGITTYYRMLNVILFWIIIGVTIWQGKKNMWMYFTVLLTPQLWYIFSYATSDAWDYFWSFMIVYLLIKEDSTINNYLKGENRGNWWMIPILGIMFAFIFQGKENYYIVLLLSFFILLEKFIKTENKKRVFINYIIILVVCFGFLYAKNQVDIYNDLTNTDHVIAENITDANAEEAFKSSNSNENLNNTLLKAKGVTLTELFVEWELGRHVFQSFVGGYGWMRYFADEGFLYIMGALYLVITVGIVTIIVQGKNRRLFIWGLIDLSICLLSFGLVVYFCWCRDFQPQGRYLLPALLAMGHLLSQDERFIKDKILKLAIVGCSVMSVYSFAHVGLSNLL